MLKIKYNLKYLLSKIFLTIFPLKFNVMSIEETLNQIQSKKSVLRFGDGEFSLISGKNILFEVASSEASNQLVKCLEEIDNDNVLICLPETLNNLSKFKKNVQKNWVINFFDNYKYYKKYCLKNYIYGNAFLSRPYMAYKDKSHVEKCFTQIKLIFKNQNIYIIEGIYSRTGVGNDLFEEAKSVSRIICPSENAFSVLEKIKISASKIPKNCLILIALGPTSKPLGLYLIQQGYWVIDIGHIDSEYEWYLRKAVRKEKIENKHTAENCDNCVGVCNDFNYLESIVDRID